MRLIEKLNGGGRRGLATVAAAVLALAGALLITIAVVSQVGAASPPPSAAGSVGRQFDAGDWTSPPSTSSPTPSPSPAPVSVPRAITIPAISAHSTLVRLGKNRDGTLAVPDSYHVAGWYTGSARPGEVGSSVIAGHVDSIQGPGVFFRLGDLRPGNEVDIARADGSTAVFVVQGVEQYPKTSFPTYAVYHDFGYPALRLITCGGTFDHATGHYRSNIVAFARLSGVRPTS